MNGGRVAPQLKRFMDSTSSLVDPKRPKLERSRSQSSGIETGRGTACMEMEACGCGSVNAYVRMDDDTFVSGGTRPFNGILHFKIYSCTPPCCSRVGREARSRKVVRLLVDALAEHNKTVLSAEDARGAISRLTLSSAYDHCVVNMVEE